MANVSVRVPIWFRLDEDGVADALANAPIQHLHVGNENVVSHELHRRTEPLREPLPTAPVVLVEAIFDAGDGEVRRQHRELLAHGVRRESLAAHGIGICIPKLAGGAVEAEQHVLAEAVSRFPHRLAQALERGDVRIKIRRKAALVTDAGPEPLPPQHRLESVIHLDTAAQRLGEARSGGRQHHELLNVNVVVGVGAAVQDVHHRHRQPHRSFPGCDSLVAAKACQMPVQRQATPRRGRLGDSQRHRENRVCAQPSLVLGAVEFDQGVIDRVLFRRIPAHEKRCDLARDASHRLPHALAEVATPIVVALLPRLALARRCSGRRDGNTRRATSEMHFRLHRWIASGVDHLPRQHRLDARHLSFSSAKPCAFAT